MSVKQNDKRKNPKSTKQSKKYFLTILAVLIILTLSLLLWRIFLYKSVDEQLAEIQSAMAIPDSENAAYYYREFFDNVSNMNTMDTLASYCQSSSRVPWNDDEFPELAALLEKHKQFIQTLLEISEHQQAVFQIYPDPLSDIYLISPLIRKVVFILSWSAANDLATGRTEEALRKYRCQIRIAAHLEQHPATYLRLVGVAIEALGLGNIRAFVMRDDVTQEKLKSVEEIFNIIRSYPEPDPELIERLDRLIGIKQRSKMSLSSRIKAYIQNLPINQISDQQKRQNYVRVLSLRRGTEILIALRRYEYENGHWPANLTEIESFVQKEILIDPVTNDSFYYRITNDGFVLFSNGPKDIPIWPKQIPPRTTWQKSDPNEKPGE